MKKLISFILVCTMMFSLAACGNSAEMEQLNAEVASLKEELSKEQDTNKQLSAENKDLQAKIDEAQPWFELSDLEKEAEQKRLDEEKAAKEEAERLAAEQAAAEAEAKEKLGYDTGITYSQLSRTPDDYKDEKVKFYGRVLQVMEADGETQLRVATSGKYDDVVLVYYDSSIVSSRVLEDDYITVYGISMGLYTYTSTMGGEITIPLIQVDKIDQ